MARTDAEILQTLKESASAIPLHDTLSSVDVEAINDIVAKGLSAVGVSAPVLNAADNTEFKLAP